MKRSFFYMFLLLLAVTACIEEKNTEDEQPVVELLSPMPCDTLYFGESFHYTAKITDNTGLGNISMDMHNNFGHHSHGAHESCSMDAVKEAVNPYSANWIFSLPEDKKEYVFDTLLTLPEMKNDTTLYDFGDYHFHIYVTDNDGYQVFTTLDVKILNRDYE
ncbi:MAG: DUF4625 domain-containing protein [Bacteroidales bacterium]|nr:DUF4625 domain-containing protein [Bacteroidales bacterium]